MQREVRAPDGIALRFEDEGDGEVPVVFVHGSFSGPRAFARVRPQLPPGRHVLPTLRGHDGRAAVFGPGYGLDTTELDDLATVIDATGAPVVDLVGHSTGGAIAACLAVRDPGRVRRVVLVEPSWFALLPEPSFQALRDAFEPALAAADRGDDAGAIGAILAFMGGTAWEAQPAESRARAVQALAPLGPVVGPHARALLSLPVDASDAAALPASTTLVFGAGTFSFQRELTGIWAGLRPDLPPVVIEGAGHQPHLERPDLLGPLLATIIGGAPSS